MHQKTVRPRSWSPGAPGTRPNMGSKGVRQEGRLEEQPDPSVDALYKPEVLCRVGRIETRVVESDRLVHLSCVEEGVGVVAGTHLHAFDRVPPQVQVGDSRR